MIINGKRPARRKQCGCWLGFVRLCRIVGSSSVVSLMTQRLTLKFSATKYLWLWAVSLWLSRSEFSALIFPLDTSGTRRAALRISPRQQLHANAHLSTTITNCFVFCRFILFGLCERSWSKRRLLWWEVKLFWVPGGFSRTFSTNWVITGSEKVNKSGVVAAVSLETRSFLKPNVDISEFLLMLIWMFGVFQTLRLFQFTCWYVVMVFRFSVFSYFLHYFVSLLMCHICFRLPVFVIFPLVFCAHLCVMS